MRDLTALKLALVLIISVALVSRIDAELADMRLDDFQKMGKTKGGLAQVQYLREAAREYADSNYSVKTADTIKAFFNTSHDSRPYGSGIYVFKSFVDSNVSPAQAHNKSVKGIVDLIIETKFGLPPTQSQKQPHN